MEESTIDIIEIFQKELGLTTFSEEERNRVFYSGNYIGAFLKTISEFFLHCNHSTLQELNMSIKDVPDKLLKWIIEKDIFPKTQSTLSLRAAMQVVGHLLNKFTSKKTGEELSTIQKLLVNITNDLFYLNLYSKEKIFSFFTHSIQSGINILVHGYSSAMVYCLINLRKQGKTFTVYFTKEESDIGKLMEDEMKQNDINVKMLDFCSVGFYMKEIDIVIVGADAICQNGGIVNKMGTLTIAICAHNFRKPFYVICDSLKFTKMFPLDEADFQHCLKDFVKEEGEESLCDYTAPEFISLMFTDVGICTPSAVSSELIQVYKN